ncbi:MAG: VOC family protein [Candidatus Thiodiazotropha taylori]|uniref:VOC family protein n=1 Tax=Candidatus Thiodiazotropha taylori TaxID=2792791 RepID=A0A9E4N3S2_9GAMM|nr:VOC family protein [Candidatus Thiodiazotropha taylori]RLW69886.1 MAG: glyoxalase [gamma proteobacterium symbiont of Stewartia floridana]MCG8027677.1 VOC family protein [Candidatus Thiodiazotropha taylori]MCG8041257.1 VOC family protein [Candidatus Thiodiazotropha taylori]MCG8051979.1 VOC family protein [Candidatus Thiodiazotropha taylori]
MISQLHHVSLLVADTGRALDFYSGLLGLGVDEQRPDLGFPGAWLQVGEQQIHLLELPNPDPLEGRPAHGGRDRHTAFFVSDFEALKARLETAGIPYTLSRSGRRALFCRDPDQNGIELIADD